jgi:hypothetical protein
MSLEIKMASYNPSFSTTICVLLSKMGMKAMYSVLNSKKLCQAESLTHLVEALASSLELDKFLIGGIYILKGLH